MPGPEVTGREKTSRLRLLDRNSRFVIRSHPGRGTAVVLYLPLVENEEEFEE